jgi:hypothetical protein
LFFFLFCPATFTMYQKPVNSINDIHSIYDFPLHSLVQLQGSSFWFIPPSHQRTIVTERFVS